MFRGFRWQLLVFILALLILCIALAFRVIRQTAVPETTPVPTKALLATTATAIPSSTREMPARATQASARKPIHGYREGLVGAVSRLNPVFAHLNAVDRDISSLIFEGLFATNDYGAAIPLLAERLVTSSDGLEYVVELRPDIYWQDGIAFGADDVVYTMSLLGDPKYAAFSDSAQFWASLETQKLSDSLLRFRLAQPLASFTNLLTVGILPEHVLRDTTIAQLAQHPFNLSPIGTGPYQLAELSVNDNGVISSIQLQRSPLYQDRLDSLDSYQISALRFTLFSNADDALDAYRTGQIDALANLGTRQQLLSLPGARIFTQLQSNVIMLIFNWDEPMFQDRRFRQALALSLDLPAMVERNFVGSATHADSPLIPGLAAYQSSAFWTTQDIERAQLLAAAVTASQADAQSEDDENDLTPVEETISGFTILVEDVEPLVNLATEIADSWRALDLRVDVESLPVDQLYERLGSGAFESAIVTQIIGSDPDPYRFWHPAQMKSGQNFGGVSSDVISEFLEGIRQADNGIIRQRLLQDFQHQFAELAIAIPLYYPLYTLAVRDAIDGIRLGYLGTSADRYRSLFNWQLASIPS